MVHCPSTAALLLLLAATATAAPPVVVYTPIPTPVAYTMKPVRTIQARVQSTKPEWNAENEVWVSNFPKLSQKFQDKWTASLDTVNTASVEGALFYVQTEGISTEVDQGCMRKTNMSYVWFYDIQFANPYFATAEYGMDGGVTPEYGKFVAMDQGQCTPKGIVPPDECLMFAGVGGFPNLGPFVGGEPRTKHEKANYQDNIWFSYPGDCYLKVLDEKQRDPSCAARMKGGMCPRGVKPDGVTCMYSFEVMGYVRLDDLVGITSLTKKSTGKPYADRTEFCRDGGIEFDFTKPNVGLPFWKDPMNATANQERSQKMMDMFADAVKGGKGDAEHFKPFPSVPDLAAKNPKCWENSPLCAQAAYGCRRKLLAQVCEVCKSPAPDCVVKPKDEAGIPALVKQFRPPAPTTTKAAAVSVSSESTSGAAAAAVVAPAAGAPSSAASVAVTMVGVVAAAVAALA
ncbi:Aste57867_8274 [Aphanomyces stellatus]|uniref:Aste57867_8274 protein n=1 Tax=Aphanomyces stellatus TaxID=120398 RepID=A0A485KJT5_9STRA|nr:hypothetical protein As57867_008243 [Aphanomyces stellatus]VFT85161.1 Aste57867_8274 [Aphanomyces stellatus]